MPYLELKNISKGFGANGIRAEVLRDINLSVDDRWLYVSCWGTGELRRCDVSNPAVPRLESSVSQ